MIIRDHGDTWWNGYYCW